MELYKNKELFIDVIRAVSNSLKINEALIEKDYFVMYILLELSKVIPGLLFKGGTCCSHAFKVIDRFSEDIDLSLNVQHFGRKHNIKANKAVLEVCDRLGFKVANREDVEKHSHGNFNRYYIEYPITFDSMAIKPFVQVEMTFYTKSYPDEIKSVTSIIGEWLVDNGRYDFAKQFDLIPFDIYVQKLERTFVDKVFAICDYYERNETSRNSRHIYDLYKISKVIDLENPDLPILINNVRNDRKNNDRCVSAKDSYDINKTLQKIIDDEYYKHDYESVTMLLLTKIVDYDTSISVIKAIINSKLFC